MQWPEAVARHNEGRFRKRVHILRHASPNLNELNLMLHSHAASVKVLLPWRLAFAPFQVARLVSTNTAINRALRKSKKALSERNVERKSRDSKPVSSIGYDRSKNILTRKKNTAHIWSDQKSSSRTDSCAESPYDYSRKPGGNRATRRAAKFGNNAKAKGQTEVADRAESLPRQHQLLKFARHNQADDATLTYEAPDSDVWPRQKYQTPPSRKFLRRQNQPETPLTIPYTTSASEFLYGTSVIQAALQASRRKLYKLYVYDGDKGALRGQDPGIRGLASQKNLPIKKVKGDWLRLMDKMSQGRPHNGYILEASSLPKQPITALERVQEPGRLFKVVLDHQSGEDEAINSTNPEVRYRPTYTRYPLVLLLDGILDSGNLGAIMRSAFFLGVDAVVVSKHSAPFSPVALKASAGAVESLPLLTVTQPNTFIDASKANGWKIYAADTPGEHKSRQKSLTASRLGNPLQKHPCILIIGSEGQGLRWKIQEKADFEVGIEGQRMGQGGIDSLNVSVAAGLLCEAFLRKPGHLGNHKAVRSTDVDNEGLFF
ncbi:MAG: hypothetical protein Q9163_000049 [Psora crenata]